MKQFAYALIDFDSTLYDTHLFSSGLKEVLLSVGVTEKDYHETMDATKHGHDGRTYRYSFAAHLSNLRQRGYDLSEGVETQMQAELLINRVANGAAELINTLKEICDHVFILSAGDQEFQMAKLNVSGLLPLVEEVIIVATSTEKLQVVEKLEPNIHKILFINDEIHQNSEVAAHYPQVVVVGRKHPVRHNESLVGDIPYFATIPEIQNFITKQYVQSHS